MSYIRCLSNPEGLYIWGESGGRIAVSILEPKGHHIYYLPRHVFHGLLKKWKDQCYGQEIIRYRGGRMVMDDAKPYGRWGMYYKGWPQPVVCWLVTWMYVCTQNDLSNR